LSDLSQRLTAALVDRYRIERELGRGGMATVFLAEDLKHERRVAIKVLDPEVAATIGPARFLREIATVARLSHPHILPLHDSGVADGLLFYVMPYVEGRSLRDRLVVEKQLPLEDALKITREVADALSCAHSRGLIHRDIKPENILLEEGHAVVADFGVARAVAAAGGGNLTATGMAVGTPAYMSPEQAAGSRDLDGRSDLYSLGCVLYEMLAGVPPFSGTTAESLTHQHLNVTPRLVTELRPAVPAGVAAALQRALAKTPADRFNPVALFGEALGSAAAVSGSPVPPPKPRSRPVVMSLAIVVLVAVVVAGGWITRERWLPRPRLREVQLTDQSWEIPLNNAALSPDGRMLLCDDWRGLHLVDSVTEESHDIPLPEPLRGHAIVYSWRADGRSFVIGPALLEFARAGLWEISVLSGKADQLRTTGGVPRVSPDGQSVAFIDKVASDSVGSLRVMDAAGDARELADVTDYLEMGWSPDGRCLAVIAGDVPCLTLFDVQRGTKSLVLKDRRLTGRWGASPGIAWLDPGRLVISMQDSIGSATMNLYELRLDPSGTRVIGSRRRLTDWRDAWVGTFTLTSDHRRLALVKGWIQTDIYCSDLGPDGARLGDPRRLTLDNGDKVLAGWTARSDGIVFHKVEDLRTYRQFLGSPTAELADERHAVLRTRWDGGSWLYDLRAPRAPAGATRLLQLVRAPVRGGAAEVLKEWERAASAEAAKWPVDFDVPPVAGVPGVVWERRDSVLVISRLDTRTGAMNEIMRLDRLAPPARFGGALSPDGGRLALTSSSGSIDLVDLRERRVSQLRLGPTGAGIVADSLAAQSVVWTPRGDALLVGTYAPGGLWRVELDGHAMRLFASRDFNNPWVGWQQVSPDGGKIALAWITTQVNAWVIEGLK
jgi:serine/threonine protein kinase